MYSVFFIIGIIAGIAGIVLFFNSIFKRIGYGILWSIIIGIASVFLLLAGFAYGLQSNEPVNMIREIPILIGGIVLIPGVVLFIFSMADYGVWNITCDITESPVLYGLILSIVSLFLILIPALWPGR